MFTMEIDEGKLFSWITRVFLERDKRNSKTLKRTSWEKCDPRRAFKDVKMIMTGIATSRRCEEATV
jgi:hypothetical protein